MAVIDSVILEVPDRQAAEAFYRAAFDLDSPIGVRAVDASTDKSTDISTDTSSAATTTGFRGFTLSLVVSQPSTVDSLIRTALDAGATELKPVAKSFWGYGGVVRAPDGAVWKVATSSKKDTGPATRQIDEIALLLGAADVKASKQFYVDHGMTVDKSFGSKYVQFQAPSGHVKLALYGHRTLAKDAGVSPDGAGSHRIVLGSDAGPFTDPDGFAWEPAAH